VHKDGLSGLERLLNEFKDGIGRFILGVARVQQHLVVLVEPEEGQVGDPDGLPMVLDLLARAVNDVRDFVSHHEFQVG